MHWEFASIWSLMNIPYFSGKVIHMSSMTRQRGVTEFQPKELFLSLTLMDEGQTNNPYITPSSHAMIFWGLLAMVAPTALIT